MIITEGPSATLQRAPVASLRLGVVAASLAHQARARAHREREPGLGTEGAIPAFERPGVERLGLLRAAPELGERTGLQHRLDRLFVVLAERAAPCAAAS